MKYSDFITNKRAAYNGRFGVMAAVTPQKRQWKFASEYPAGSLVEAATTPSRWDVIAKFRFAPFRYNAALSASGGKRNRKVLKINANSRSERAE